MPNLRFSVAPLAVLLLAASPFACAGGVAQDDGAGGASSTTTDAATTATTTGATTTATTSATSGTGGGPCTSAADCSAVNDACNVGTCINGVCEKGPANELGACDDGLFCTTNDACQAGVCSGGAMPCPSGDTCHIGTCDAATDACVLVPGNDGASCVDQDPCTQSGVCSAGVCSPGATIDCSFLDGTCSKGSCDPAIGCVVMPLNDGSACDDSLYCTVLDVCTGGICGGVPNNCAAPGNTCMIGTCDELSKSCTAINGPNNVACDDLDSCTANTKCFNGTCQGGVAANPGGACDDGDACTLNEICTAGACGGGSVVVACVDADGCCPAGCLLANDSDCSLTRWTDGTNNWPDQACNSQNSFGGCNTNAQDHADAWATFVCGLNGYTSGVWTGNKMPGCSGEISMYCGGNIPCTPLYEFNCAQSDQTQIELTCFP